MHNFCNPQRVYAGRYKVQKLIVLSTKLFPHPTTQEYHHTLHVCLLITQNSRYLCDTTEKLHTLLYAFITSTMFIYKSSVDVQLICVCVCVFYKHKILYQHLVTFQYLIINFLWLEKSGKSIQIILYSSKNFWVLLHW